AQEPGSGIGNRGLVAMAREHARNELGSTPNGRARKLCKMLEVRSRRVWIDHGLVRRLVLSKVGEDVHESVPNRSWGGERVRVPAIRPKLPPSKQELVDVARDANGEPPHARAQGMRI